MSTVEPPVPDLFSRRAVEHLWFEMDRCGLQAAVLVAARTNHNYDAAADGGAWFFSPDG